MVRWNAVVLAACLALVGTGELQAADYADPQWPNIAGEPGYVPGKSGSPRWPSLPRQPDVSAFTGEFGLRYWYSWGKTQKDLYGLSRDELVSRLTYDDLSGHSGEVYGRLDHSNGLFLKGYAGGGILPDGSLNDEDFPPLTTPYSSTDSRQREGHLAYASIDAGFNLLRRPDFRFGVFGGYHYLEDKVSAYGCQQLAGNPSICGGGGIPDSILAISQNNRWQSVRVGADADLRLSDRLMLRLDAAWLPYVRLSGTDFHWLRIGNNPGDFTGGIPEDGKGKGYQLEAVLTCIVHRRDDIRGIHGLHDQGGVTIVHRVIELARLVIGGARYVDDRTHHLALQRFDPALNCSHVVLLTVTYEVNIRIAKCDEFILWGTPKPSIDRTAQMGRS